jgi:hypothetical protein
MRSRADKLRAIINCPTVNPNERLAAQRALAKHEANRAGTTRVYTYDPAKVTITINGAGVPAWQWDMPFRVPTDDGPAAEHGYQGRWEADARGSHGYVLTFDVKREDAPGYIRGTSVRVKAPDGKVYDCRVLAMRLCPRYQPSHIITEPVEAAARTPFAMGGYPRF